MNATVASSDTSLTRLSHANQDSFLAQLQSLEDFLSSNNHTFESAMSLLFKNMEKTPETEAKAKDFSRKIRELYQFRDFLIKQRDERNTDSPVASSPIKLRRLARV
jgi:hypothetical protein